MKFRRITKDKRQKKKKSFNVSQWVAENLVETGWTFLIYPTANSFIIFFLWLYLTFGCLCFLNSISK